jgi:hypothetical protein
MAVLATAALATLPEQIAGARASLAPMSDTGRARLAPLMPHLARLEADDFCAQGSWSSGPSSIGFPSWTSPVRLRSPALNASLFRVRRLPRSTQVVQIEAQRPKLDVTSRRAVGVAEQAFTHRRAVRRLVPVCRSLSRRSERSPVAGSASAEERCREW